MYMVPLKAALVEALRATFNASANDGYPESDFQNTWVGIEFPMEQQNYPGVWVTYEDSDPVEIAGINHRELIEDEYGSGLHLATRYRFFGTVTFTVVAMTSWERDRLYDEIVRILAFARVQQEISIFRKMIENNDFIGINLSFDILRPSGDSSGMGTPWQTNEVVYEKSLSIDLIGDFASGVVIHPTKGGPISTLIPLSAIQVQGYREGDPPPALPDDVVNPDVPALPTQPFDFTNWH